MYPEKARWALDYKRVPHIRHSLLPGPYAAMLLPRFGQKAMPILRHNGRVLKNSAAVLDYVEQIWPDPPLYPADPVQRERALEIQKWFDDEIGPAVRRATFYEWLPHTEYTARRFATGRVAPEAVCEFLSCRPRNHEARYADQRNGRRCWLRTDQDGAGFRCATLLANRFPGRRSFQHCRSDRCHRPVPHLPASGVSGRFPRTEARRLATLAGALARPCRL